MKIYVLMAISVLTLTMNLTGCGSQKNGGGESASELDGYIGDSELRAFYYYGRIYVRTNQSVQNTEVKLQSRPLGIGSFAYTQGRLPVYYTQSISANVGDSVDVKTTLKLSGKAKTLSLVFARGSYGLELKIKPEQTQPTNPSNPTLPSNPTDQVNQPSDMPTGDIDSKFKAKNGLESRYRMQVPTDYAKSQRGLLVYLHGDLHLELYGNYFIDQMNAMAKRHNLIPIAVYAPGSGERWWTNGASNADLLQELLTKVKSDYRTTSDRVFFYSMSGGSLFNSAYFIPKYGANYKGGSAFMCGGASVESESISPAKISKNLKMLFYTHPTDFLYSNAVQAFRYYQSMGAEVKFENPILGGHCVLQPNDKMESMLSQWEQK